MAALSHPNILSIFDFGKADGIAYAVTELLEGESLRERLRPGALPMRKAAECAIQIAHGLAAAHDKGIVHRDLKPENVFVSRDGHVKILDFGLARQVGDCGRGQRKRLPHRGSPDRARQRARNCRLHVARAGARPAGRPPLGHLLARVGAVRDGDRRAGLQARDGGRDDDRDPARGPARPARAGEPQHPARARPGAHAAPLPREVARGALPVGARPRLRPRSAVGLDAERRLGRSGRAQDALPGGADRGGRRRGRPRRAGLRPRAARALKWQASLIPPRASPSSRSRPERSATRASRRKASRSCS